MLIAGGRNGTTSLNTAQLYSPTAGTWVAAGNLNAARQQHTATLLPNGRVLVTGGVSGTTVLATAANYNPTTGAGTWAATTGPMPGARKFHTATLISTTNQQLNGKVLVTGGNSGTASQSSVYLYDPAQLAFSTLANMAGSAREGHTATVLSNTKILLAGGKNGATTLNTAVVYDPGFGPGSWSTVGNMTAARQGHSASLLSNGQVLVAGGANGTAALSSAELFNGTTTWVATTAMPAAVQAQTATLLANNIVLIAGGLNGTATQSAARLYDVTGGNTCTTGSQCLSGNCVGGVCCNTACPDQCSSCSLTGLVGICSPRPNGTTCSDNNACTQTDTCQAGTCTGANPVTCTANDACHTAGTCNPSSGTCDNPAAPDGTACNDANACTQSDTCQAGACTGTNPITCVALDQCHDVGACNSTTGACSNPSKVNGTACTDNSACTASDTCQAGNCQPGAPIATDDNNPCTADTCDPINGVTHTPVAPGTTCTDGNICTGAGTCDAASTCIPGTIPTLDDGNPCTADTCDPVSGVQHTPVATGTSCADTNVCNGNETCDTSGLCIAGTPPSIDDGNPCTADSCEPVAGIAHAPVAVGTSCSDGNACNGSETCNAGGSCTPGTPPPTMDDGNPCTADSCDPGSGAIAHDPVPAGTACTSSDVCNSGQTCDAQGQCQGGTPANVDDGDPSTIDTCVPGEGVRHRQAAAIDKTVITTTLAANQWLYTGTDPIQTGVAPGTIELRRAAVIHGYVKDRQGQPIPNVTISVLGHPEFGTTITQANGRYDMVVNGGGQLTVKYTKTGLLEAQRNVNAPWDDHTWASDAVMIPSDPAVTSIDLTSSSEFQIAQGSIITDNDGERQATILFPADNIATMTLPDGTTQTPTTLHVRATEFTVGDSGPNAMPAELPPTTAYTYAVEINADEAVAAGAKSVKFDKALPLYVNNFLGFAPGIKVPMGSYNREIAQWIPEDSGLVIAVLDNSGGNVQLDIDGTGVPATTAQLAAIGVTDAERLQLAGLYATGQSFWRVQVKHFTSPIDLNWPKDPPVPPPVPPPPPDPIPPCTSTCCGGGSGSGPAGPTASGSSVLKCGERVYSETVPIAGTPFNLVYESDRVPGYRKPNILAIPIVGSSSDVRVLKIYVGVRIDGRDTRFDFIPNAALGQDFNLLNQDGDHFVYEFRPTPYLTYPFNWDGKDLNGNTPIGPQKATVAVGYFYDSPYWYVDRFGNIGAFPVTSNFRPQPTLQWWRTETTFNNVGPWDARSVGLGGWTLNVQHTYDARTRQVQYGSGGHSPGAASTTTIQRVAGICQDQSDSGDNGPAINATISPYWNNTTTGPDGSIYISQGTGGWPTINRIRKIDPSGIITTIAGGNDLVTPGGPIINSVGDGGLAINANFNILADVAVGKDGSLYVIDNGNYRIRRIDPSGIINTIAGTGVNGYSGDGGPATQANISDVRSIAIGPDGSIFFVDDGGSIVRRVTPDGTIKLYAGWGIPMGPDPDEVAATATNISAVAIDVGADGSLYIADGSGRVRRITPDGIIHHVKGIGPGGLEYNGGAWVSPFDVAVAPNGDVYASTIDGSIYLLRNDTAIPVVGGPNLVLRDCGEVNWPPVGIYVGNTKIALSPTGELYYGNKGRLLRSTSSYPGLSEGTTLVQYFLPDSANNQLYEFDGSGRHLGTRNLTTGVNIYSFAYDANGLLASITHDNAKQTVIQRDANGVAQAIVSPYGQTTQLTDYDANGYVRTVRDPLLQTSLIDYSTSAASLGLVNTFTNQRGATSIVTYDADGTVLKDQDTLGGFKSLTLLDKTPTSSDVQLKTALGVTTLYHFEQPGDGSKHDIVTWPDTTQTTSDRLANEVSNTTLPDGTTISQARAPDPIWGMNLPITTTTTTLPSGLQRIQAVSRTATSDSTDQATLITETITQAINNRNTTTVFDPTNLTYTTTTPAGRTTTRYIDTTLRTTKIQRPNIADLIFAYDADRRLTTITQGTRVTTRTYYDSGDINGYLQTLTNPLSQTTTFIPDALGRTLQQTLDTATTLFSWDENSNLTSVTPPGKPAHVQTYTPVDMLQDYLPPPAGMASFATNYQYNLDKQLTLETRPDTVQTNRSYDSAGRLDLLTMPTGALDYTYYPAGCSTPGCAAGKLASIAGPGAEALAFTYDGQLQKSATWSGLVNGSVGWTYDTDFRKVTETVQAGTTSMTAAFGYDADSLLTCASPTTCPSGAGALTIARNSQNALLTGTTLGSVTDSYTYNTYGELATYQAKYGSTSLYSVTYDATGATRDALGRVVQKTETLQGTTHVFTYGYDVQGRLTDVARDGTAIEHYGYDLNGNRTTATVGGTTVNPTYDEQDRLLTYGNATYTYTANGELRTKTDSTGTTTYTYDAMGSLIAVNLPNGRLIEYVTDGKGRQIGKMVNGVLTKQWLYRDQLKPAAELDGAGNLVSQFLYGTKSNVPDLVIRGGSTYRIVSDQLGSPILAINTANSSDIQFQAAYAAFGERTLLAGTDDWIPFGFAGGQYDPDTKLTRFGARDYSSAIGRWVSKDPIRFKGGQTSIYVYVGNDPVNRLDMFGLDSGDPACAAALIQASFACAGCITFGVATALDYGATAAWAIESCAGCGSTIVGAVANCQPPQPPPTPPTPPVPTCFSNEDWNTY